MNIYNRNIKWLILFAPFTLLPLSGAYVAPFFLDEGLSQSQIFLLQSIYSIVYLTWNIPSGYLADKYGRALSIKIGALVAATAMIFYGFGSDFLHFALCEAGLALGEGMMQGADKALLIDSLAHEKRDGEYVKLSQRINALGWAGAALGVPLGMLLVSHVGIGAVLTADGILIAIGAIIALRLREVPRAKIDPEQSEVTAWKSLRVFISKKDIRWLLTLTISLSSATYLAFWLAAPYYLSLGIPVILFGAIFAIRSAWKAWLSHTFHTHNDFKRTAKYFSGISGFAYIAMATQQLWLMWTVLGLDLIEALQAQPIVQLINKHIPSSYRATLNSVVDLSQRLVFMIVGPLVGLMVDSQGLQFGLVVVGVVCSAVSFLAINRLTKLQVF